MRESEELFCSNIPGLNLTPGGLMGHTAHGNTGSVTCDNIWHGHIIRSVGNRDERLIRVESCSDIK